MKCLVVSDLHYTLKQFDWVLQAAEKFDLVVIAGDHLDISSTVALPAQVTVILTYLKRLQSKTRVIVCSGNHDLDARNGDGEKFAKWIQRARHSGVPTDNDCVIVQDALFTICPWWDGPESRARVEVQLERDAEKPKDRWIWVYHAPPDESPTSWGGQKHFGDRQLVEWIARHQPDMVITGHIHQSPFRQGGSWVDRLGLTWVFNPGRQIGPCPTHIVIDTEAKTALWFSLAGAEIVPLSRPLTRPIPELTELPDWLR
ncbi:metallophosphoesterase family protein [Methylotetracoccus oryzae]|uniref:metallophosphoesterase family protein n=1 Tax=Methylotetracoccus oryzae TaxID=1919059 RepID=UPI001117CCB8|nr:metallophosphoesterase [Methylotetracoccus oryzae]